MTKKKKKLTKKRLIVFFFFNKRPLRDIQNIKKKNKHE